MDGQARDGGRESRPEGPGSDRTDFRDSAAGRRQSWYGLKRWVKRFFGWRIPNLALRGLVRFRPDLRRTGRLPAPAHVKEVEGHAGGTRFVMLRPDRCVVAKELYWGGGRRPRPQDDFAIELFGALARRADVMLDIGAYTGIFTLVGTQVNPNLEAHAFEIVPDVYRMLFDNCVRNGVLHRTTLHHVGIGNRDGLIRIPAGSTGSALPDFYSSRLHFETGVLVRLRSLDSLCASLPAGGRVVIKVDVEGTENEVFAGGREFLTSFGPDILCEVLAGVGNGAELETLLAPHGYRFYLVREADLLPSDHVEPDPRFRDWFFTKRDPDELAATGLVIGSPT